METFIFFAIGWTVICGLLVAGAFAYFLYKASQRLMNGEDFWG